MFALNRFCIILIALFLSTVALAADDFFPPDNFVDGWTTAYPVEEYRNSQELFQYMDGGAELYLEYRFAGVQVKEYSNSDGGSLTVEIYTYAEPWDAYGIYSVDTTGIKTDLGYGGRKTSVAARFWKGNYYVKAFVWERNPDYASVPEAAAAAVAENLPDNRDMLPYLQKLFDTGLQPVFVRGEIGLNQVSGRFKPTGVDYNRKRGAVWLFPTENTPAAGLVLAHGTAEKVDSEYARVWDMLLQHAANYVEGSNRGFVTDTEQKVHSLAKYLADPIFVFIWIPDAAEGTACGETIDFVIHALESAKE